MRKSFVTLGLVTLLTAAIVAPAAAVRPAQAGSQRPTIVSRAVEINAQTGEFSTLLALATQYPDIVEALTGKQQLTLFAPTDQAFSDLFAFLGTLGVAAGRPDRGPDQDRAPVPRDRRPLVR